IGTAAVSLPRRTRISAEPSRKLRTTEPEIAATAGSELVISHRYVTSIGGPAFGLAVTRICCCRLVPCSMIGAGSMRRVGIAGDGWRPSEWFIVGTVRHSLPLEMGFHRWTDSQQETFADTLAELSRPPAKVKDTQVTWDVLFAVRRLSEFPSVGPDRLMKS